MNVTKGDNNITLVFNILKDNIVESILGATITLQFFNPTTGTIMRRDCQITEASSAECTYIIVSKDTQEVGTFATQISVLYSNGTHITCLRPLTLTVLDTVVDENV